MKTITYAIAICLLATLIPFQTQGQNDNDQMFAIYTYEIKPEKVKAEEAFVKEMKAKFKQYNVESPTWSTAVTNTNSFMYIVPIENMAQLDDNPWGPIIKKMGEDNWKKFTDKAKGHESSSSSSVSVLDSELSYMPEGLDPTTEGQDFRAWNIFHIKPGKYDEAKAVAKKIREVYAANKSKFYYRVYHNRFGGDGNTMVIVSSHRNMGDYYQNVEAARSLVQKDIEKLYDELLTYVVKQNRVYGNMRPDLSN
jgi:hypothetical protein